MAMNTYSPTTSPGKRWWLVHTRANHERVLARRLETMGIDVYLPMVSVKRRRHGRSSVSEIPLFTGYMFLRGGQDERYAAMTTNRAAAIHYVRDQHQLATSIDNIRRAIESGETVDPFPGIKKGRRCRVRRGPLKGLEGVVLRRTKVARVYIAVEALGQSAELQIDADYLELIG